MGLQVSRGDLEKASSTVRSGLDKIAQSATETQNPRAFTSSISAA